MIDKKRILLIAAYQGRDEPKGAIFPLGLCYIATSLAEKQHNVSVFDPNLCDSPYEEIKKKVQEFAPEVIGLSIRNIDTLNKSDIFYYFKTVSPTIKIIKEVAPESKIIVGGSGFSLFAKNIMDRIPEIDYGVYLEGEESVQELVEKLESPDKVLGIFYRLNGQVNFSGPRALPDFDSLPIPRRDFLDITRYSYPLGNVGIQTKRGCPQRCAYCNYPFLNGKKVRARSPANVVDEIEYLVEKFGVRQFMFADAIFNVPEKHAREICEEILNRGLDVEWAAWCELKVFSEEFLLLAKKAGCRRIPFSPDGASNPALHTLRKGIATKDIHKVFRIIRKHKEIATAFGFFGTPPNQTFLGVLNTIYLYLKINLLLFSRQRSGASISWIRIEPDTEIQRIAIEERIIDKETELLPYKEEELEKLYYTSPSMWLGDRLIELVLWLVERLLKSIYRFAKQFLRVFRVKH